MDIDPLHMAGLVTRAVKTVDRDGRPAKLLSAGRTYPTSVDDLWDALTDIERIPRWFLPVTGDLRPGGRFRLEGNAEGEVLVCEPPRHFEITWEYGGEVSWVTVDLSGDVDGDRAHVELQHLAHVPEDMWDQFGPGATGVGWDLGLMGLDLHVASGQPLDPAEVESWTTSPEGVAFVSRSSAGWADASIADGTDETAARASAERVTGFYTTAEQ